MLSNTCTSTLVVLEEFSFLKNVLNILTTLLHSLPVNVVFISLVGKIDIGHVRLNFWDLGGQEELQSLWDKYFAESHAVIYIVDSSDTERIDESKDAFEKMISNAQLQGVPLLVLANKQDLQECMTVPSVKQVFFETSEKFGGRDCNIMGISALKGEGVREGILWLVESIKNNSVVRPPMQKEIT